MAEVIDVHIHVAARKRAGCKVSREMLLSPSFAYMLLANGVSAAAVKRDFDGTIRKQVLGALDGAASVRRGVLLALDAIYTREGRRCDDESGMIVSNEYVRELARSDPKVLFGASVNPNRGERDGTAELERCLDGPQPAALVKWIPNSQLIDPSEARHDWFYRALAAARVPLLCHSGPEYAVPVPAPAAQNQELGDPRRLRRALDAGVTVIVAHCGTRFFPTDELDYLDDLATMMGEYPQLYADLSAMCVLCRIGTVDRVLDKLDPDRLVLGSDFPIPINDMPPLVVKGLTPAEHLECIAIPNPIEKNYRQLLAMGFPVSIGTKAAELLNPRCLT